MPETGEADKKQKAKPKAAKAQPKNRAPKYASIDEISRNESMARLRDLYAENGLGPFDREELLAMMRDFYGFGALGTKIRKELSGDIRAAVLRGILDSKRGQYAILCHHIDQYDPSFLREQFLASLSAQGRNPRAWVERDYAIQQAARYLGFRRTGPSIDKAFRSAINSTIRRGELERGKGMVRRT